MKKQIVILFAWLVCAVSFIGCKKAADERDKYMGSFEIKLKTYQWSLGTGKTNEAEEVNRGEAFYQNGKANKGKFGIKYKDSEEPVFFKIDVATGAVFLLCDAPVGAFDDSGDFNISWKSNSCDLAGSGGYSSITLEGNKLEF